MDDSFIEVECLECGKTLFRDKKISLLEIHWKVNQITHGSTTKEMAEELLSENPEANIDLDVTPSANTLNRYEIDTNHRVREEVKLNFTMECECGLESEIILDADYSGPVDIDLKVSPVNT